MYIKYYDSGGHRYAKLLEAKRDLKNGQKYNKHLCYLGRVISEAEGIFKSRERGVFKFTLNRGFSEVEDPTVYLKAAFCSSIELILDFGPEYVFIQALKKDGILDVFASLIPKKTDTLMSLILHNMLFSEARRYAEDFWKASYTRIAFPNAKLKSQRISEFLSELGDEQTFRKFFNTYLSYVVNKTKTSKHSIIVDSTGLQNDSQMYLTATNVHNGVRSSEVRLILALDRKTRYPLYFRYVKGTILDVSSLSTTIADIERYGISVDHCILDAGYYCADNVEDLNFSKIPYLLRLRAGNNIYNGLIAGHIDGLDTFEHRVVYGKRVVFIKCVPIDFHGSEAFAYVSIDHDAQAGERRRIYMKRLEEFESIEEREGMLRACGVFILISKIQVGVDEILPLYYSRQAVEQVFDFEKNYANLLPLRTHSEGTFRGHLLVSFMATVSIMTIDKMFLRAHPRAKKKTPLNFIHARSCLRQMKCHVYDGQISVTEPDRQSNDVLKALKIEYSRHIPCP
jgi:hypothetical protein